MTVAIEEQQATVRRLSEVRSEPSKEIVGFLEHLLDKAKQGEIIGMAAAIHYRGHLTGSGFSIEDDGDISVLVTAIERVKLKLLNW